jgi:disulfide bond formation protein DsbB
LAYTAAMNSLRRTVFRSWPLVAALCALAILGVAHGFESFGGYAPCHLCLQQREIYWVAVAVGLIGWAAGRFVKGKQVIAITSALLCLIFLGEAGLAAYHAGVEWKFWPGPQSCTGASTGQANIAAIQGLLNGAQIHSPRCDVAAWRMAGLSMAGWNVLVALALAFLSGGVVLGREITRGLEP